MRHAYRIIVAASLIILSSQVTAAVIYVDDSAPAGGDGASWNTAFRHLQDALAVASEGDEIRVGQGTYRPDESEYGNAIYADRTSTFQLFEGIVVRGGFAGHGDPNPDARDVARYRSTLSADVLEDDGPDFQYWQDNIYLLVEVLDAFAAPTLDGFLLTGSRNDINDDVGGGLAIRASDAVVMNCTFDRNYALTGGAIYCTQSNVLLDNCVFTRNRASWGGSAISSIDSYSLEMSNCLTRENGWDVSHVQGGGLEAKYTNFIHIRDSAFENNTASFGGGATMLYGVEAIVSGCEFNDNIGAVGVGGLAISATTCVVTSCYFRNNDGGSTGGGLSGGGGYNNPRSIISNCVFIENSAGFFGGGCLPGGAIPIVNCVFYRNSAPAGGGLLLSAGPAVNCTFVENQGGGISAGGDYDRIVANCVLWNNSPTEVTPYDDVELPIIVNSNIRGGYAGPGNIDADPLFVQPGTTNFRLAHGSPCLDAGSNGELPADVADLDDDGDTSEPLPVDLAGSARVENGTVDMSAYEGAFDMLPPAAMHDDLDPGEFTTLLPSGGEFLDEDTLAVRAFNMSEQHNGTVIVTDLRGTPRGAGGVQPMLRVETDLPPGEVRIRAKVPFTADSLLGGDPLAANLVRYDSETGEWLLAPAKNLTINPAFNEPIGVRYIVEGDDTTLPSAAIGDYGVFWNPAAMRGFTWANTDIGGEFSQRYASCPADGAPYGGNGFLDVFDLFGLLAVWGQEHRWYDTDGDGVVTDNDLFTQLDAWGMCE